jgi:hypothetical protein
VLWSERRHGWLAEAELRVAFDDLGGATRIQVDADITFKGPFKALAPFVRRLMPAALSADLHRAAALARPAAHK